MGNCLTNDSPSSGGRELPAGRAKRIEEEEEGSTTSVLKVKMVLTKAELEWLMAQLKAGDRRLEDVLRDMERKRDGCRAGAGGWRPSLESILECDEQLEAHRITVRDIVVA